MRNRLLIYISLLSLSCSAQQNLEVNPKIEVRDGFKLELVNADLKSPRFMQIAEDKVLFVSLPREGKIMSLRDNDQDGYYETKAVFTEDHKLVHGMHWKDGWLWFAETGAIFKARDTNGDGKADEEIEVVKEGEIPGGGGHWWRPVLIMNDRIYTAIGCSGNITDETDTERLKIWSFDLNGGDKRYYCGGLRNTEKLVNRPGTDEIWGMDHGSDWFGKVMEKKEDVGQPITDLNPPCEMNKYVEGAFYGHPYITGTRVPRYEYMDRPDIAAWAAKTSIPEWLTGAHHAPNAMCFYDGKMFPEEFRGDAFVAYHGSWNRSTKGGYAVTRVLFENGKPYGELKMVNFLGEDQSVFGRPVDVIVAPDGSLLISDDYKNRIYRLSDED